MRFRGMRHKLINNKLRWTSEDNLDATDLADDSVGISELSATGTASNTTFLRGDNTWSTPVGGEEDFTTTLKNKLDNIEPSADVTDSTNVNAAGAVMNSDFDTKGELLVGGSTLTALTVGSDDQVLTADSSEASGVKWAAAGGGGSGLYSAFALIEDQKDTDVPGGSSAGKNTWQTRDLNTEVYDGGNIVTLSSNQFTLAAGTYYIHWGVPNTHSYQDHTVTTLVEIDGETETIIAWGTGYQGSGTEITHGRTIKTFNATKTFEIQQITSGPNSGTGLSHWLGYASWDGLSGVTVPNDAYNTFSFVEIYKFA